VNSKVSTSAAGKKLPAMSHGSVIFCASAALLFGSVSFAFAVAASPAAASDHLHLSW
jgi:hypothetical protein